MTFKTHKLIAFGIGWLIILAGVNFAFGAGGNGNQAIKQMQSQANLMKERLLKGRAEEIDAHTSSAQEKIQAVNESAEVDIAAVPQFFYNAWGYAVPNPDYERTVAYIRVEAQKKINAINKDLEAMTKTINSAYQEKLNAIDTSVASVDSQIKPGTSDIQLSPQGSNLYVKNYVNYAVDRTKPQGVTGLKAKEKSLACKTAKTRDVKP
jgi:hypothetical protein